MSQVPPEQLWAAQVEVLVREIGVLLSERVVLLSELAAANIARERAEAELSELQAIAHALELELVAHSRGRGHKRRAGHLAAAGALVLEALIMGLGQLTVSETYAHLTKTGAQAVVTAHECDVDVSVGVSITLEPPTVHTEAVPLGIEATPPSDESSP